MSGIHECVNTDNTFVHVLYIRHELFYDIIHLRGTVLIMQEAHGHSILLGGVGGDAHFVGLTILQQALLMNHYNVHSIGIQNHLEDFFRFAQQYNVVMISNMDGHAQHYLAEFPEFMKKYRLQNTLWYLGGNLHIGEALGYESLFREMGFHRVFIKFVDTQTVIQFLRQDLHEVAVKPLFSFSWTQQNRTQILTAHTIDDGILEEDMFNYTRQDVLSQWKTGQEAKNLYANAEFLGKQPSFAQAQQLVRERQLQPLLQPRSGVAQLAEQITLLMRFKSAGVNVQSFQVDSLTRNGDYQGAEEELKYSLTSKSSTLNGLPIINYGVHGLRRLIKSVNAPMQIRHSAYDPRLLAEISYAGGATSFEGGCIGYNLPYFKDYPVDKSIATWKYVDRLTGLYYEKFGITIDREFFGVLTGTLIPPSLAIVTNIIEAILALKQGVKSISLGYAEQGNRIQDIAAMRVLAQMTAEIIANLGYKNIQISTVFHQYMAAFPQNEQRAKELIYNSAITGALANATRLILKTPVEAYKIPTLADNLLAISLGQGGLKAASTITIDEKLVAQECYWIRREVQAIFEGIIQCDIHNFAHSVVMGIQKGLLDIPFAPSLYNKGNVITARDITGAVRFVSIGNLPFDHELREFHRDKIQTRRHTDNIPTEDQSYQLVEQDVMQISRGDYDTWPLSN